MADLEKTVPEFVHAPTTEPVIPLTDHASVTRVGLAVTAPNVSLAWGQPINHSCLSVSSSLGL